MKRKPSSPKTSSTSSAELTARQQEVLDFILNFLWSRGYQPSLREIGAALGIKSLNGIAGHIRALHRKGAVGESMGSRAIDLSQHL